MAIQCFQGELFLAQFLWPWSLQRFIFLPPLYPEAGKLRMDWLIRTPDLNMGWPWTCWQVRNLARGQWLLPDSQCQHTLQGYGRERIKHTRLNGFCYEGLWAAGMELFAENIIFCYLCNWIDCSLLTLYFVKQNSPSHSPIHRRRQRLVVWLGAVCGDLVSRLGIAVSATTSQGQRSMAGHLDLSQVGCKLWDGVQCVAVY